MATITKGVTTITPDLVIGWETTNEARTVLHPLISSEVPAVTMRPSSPRSGTLRMLWSSYADAEACRVLHVTSPAPMTLADPVLGAMRYVVAGRVTTSAQDDPGTVWAVDVEYQEVPS